MANPAASFAGGVGAVGGAYQTRSVLGLLAVIVFIIALVLSVGVFGYKFYLKSQIASLGSQLDAARQSLEPGTINDLARLNTKLSSTRGILLSHVAISPLFDLLEKYTVQSIRFTEFNYAGAGANPTPTLILKGSAHGYSAVAYQSKTFSDPAVAALKQPVFSDLNLDDKGNVGFTVTATVDPALISFAKEVAPAVVPSGPSTTLKTNAATSTATTTVAVASGTTTPTKK